MSQTIAVIRGDGIGPEIMDATLEVLNALNVGLEYDFVDAGLSAYEKTGELLWQLVVPKLKSGKVKGIRFFFGNCRFEIIISLVLQKIAVGIVSIIAIANKKVLGAGVSGIKKQSRPTPICIGNTGKLTDFTE